MPESGRHLSFFQLRDAMRSPGCPVCRQAGEAVASSVRALLHELVNDDATRSRIAAGGGFCREHAWRLVEQSDALGVAIIHRDLVIRLRQRVRAGGGRGGVRRDCPLCAVREDAAARSVATLLSHVAEEPLRAAFAASDGLCAPHLEQAVTWRKAPRGAVAALTELQDACLARLVAQLDALIRTFDYRVEEPPGPEESTSWIRAVAAISGLDERRLPPARPASFPPPRRTPD